MLTQYQSNVKSEESDAAKHVSVKVFYMVAQAAKLPVEVLDRLKDAKNDTLNLAGLKIEDDDVEFYLVDFLNENPNITYLNIKNNAIGDEGLKLLGEVKTLKKIDMDVGEEKVARLKI